MINFYFYHVKILPETFHPILKSDNKHTHMFLLLTETPCITKKVTFIKNGLKLVYNNKPVCGYFTDILSAKFRLPFKPSNKSIPLYF